MGPSTEKELVLKRASWRGYSTGGNGWLADFDNESLAQVLAPPCTFVVVKKRVCGGPPSRSLSSHPPRLALRFDHIMFPLIISSFAGPWPARKCWCTWLCTWPSFAFLVTLCSPLSSCSSSSSSSPYFSPPQCASSGVGRGDSVSWTPRIYKTLTVGLRRLSEIKCTSWQQQQRREIVQT